MNKNAKGFTLLEVLIALGIVSVISILSWQGLQEVLRSANRVTEVDEQIQTVAAVKISKKRIRHLKKNIK